MDSMMSKPFHIHFFALNFLTILCIIQQSNAITNYTTLVFTRCANQTYTTSTESHARTLNWVLQQLRSQSKRSKFSKAAVINEMNMGLSAVFQCRGDLGYDDCHKCVSSITRDKTNISSCDKAASARIQLNGCFFKYEADGYVLDDSASHEVLHETCSDKKVGDVGFLDARDSAFVAVEEGVVIGNGFWEGDYGLVHVLGQCDEGLGGCDCSECVSYAANVAVQDCGNSVSGEVYVDKCFLKYAYNTLDGSQSNSSPAEDNAGNSTGKMVAIVLGGAATLFCGLIFFKFIKSCRKKDDF